MKQAETTSQQGGTPRIPTSVSINGTQITNELHWQGKVVPTGNPDAYDTIAYTIYNSGGEYQILAQLITFG